MRQESPSEWGCSKSNNPGLSRWQETTCSSVERSALDLTDTGDSSFPPTHQCQKMMFSMAKDNSQKIGLRVQKT